MGHPPVAVETLPEPDAPDFATRFVSCEEEEVLPDGLLAGPLSPADMAARVVCTHDERRFACGTSRTSLRYACMSRRGFQPAELQKPNYERYLEQRLCGGDVLLLSVLSGHGSQANKSASFVSHTPTPSPEPHTRPPAVSPSVEDTP